MKCDVCENSFEPKTCVDVYDVLAASGVTWPQNPSALGNFSVRIATGVGRRAKLCSECAKKILIHAAHTGT